jgi:hypothetical protein
MAQFTTGPPLKMTEHPLRDTSACPVLSDAAVDHIKVLLIHRLDLSRLVVELAPDHCAMCREIGDWADAMRVPEAR